MSSVFEQVSELFLVRGGHLQELSGHKDTLAVWPDCGSEDQRLLRMLVGEVELEKRIQVQNHRSVSSLRLSFDRY